MCVCVRVCVLVLDEIVIQKGRLKKNRIMVICVTSLYSNTAAMVSDDGGDNP